MDEVIKTLPTLGVGGLIAALVLYWYRTDSTRNTEAWKGQAEMLIQVVKENTRAVAELSILVKSLHEHMILNDKLTDRRDDTGKYPMINGR